MSSIVLRPILNGKTPNDIFYTPKPVALKMIEMCGITPEMKVLDPSKGAGIFYDNLGDCDKHYCEITEGKDFFEETERYDLIIGNPPYSKWTRWIDHTMKLTDKFCYIFGILNFTPTRLNRIINAGFGITQIHFLKVYWWFGQSMCVVFEKNKPSIITVEQNPIVCDVCNTRCLRGVGGRSVNECCPKVKR